MYIVLYNTPLYVLVPSTSIYVRLSFLSQFHPVFVCVQLCATGHGRKVLRDKQTYVIIRELHQWEPEAEVAEACEQLIGMLIADEPEPGKQNLHKVVIPDHLSEEFEGCRLKCNLKDSGD